MPAATRNGDKCTGHDACPPVPLVEFSPNVNINKLGAGRVGDQYSTHGCVSHPGHQDVIAAGSSDPNLPALDATSSICNSTLEAATIIIHAAARMQPYAFAIVAGLKQYETRPRRTNVRGRVAVHAGKKWLNADGLFALLNREIAYGKILETEYNRGIEHLKQATELVYGAVVGTVEIVDCVPVEEIMHTLTERERALGDYSPGRFAWALKNPVMFDTPIAARGKQGWWNWKGVILG